MRSTAFAAQLWHGPAPWLISVASLAFLALVLTPQSSSFLALCGRLSLPDLATLIDLLLPLWSPWQLALHGSLMVIAMMTPLVALQISHIWRSTPKSRRVASTIAFLLAYYTCWLLVSVVLFFLLFAVPRFLAAWADTIIVAALTSMWSASPVAQAARNRCHKVLRIRAFGSQAYLDSLIQGVATGANCVVACWPWMMVPMVVDPSWHIAAMLIVTVYLFAERIAPVAPVSWQIPPAWETFLGPLWLHRR